MKTTLTLLHSDACLFTSVVAGSPRSGSDSALRRITLFDIVGLHNGIVHLNCPPGQKYAPIAIQ